MEEFSEFHTHDHIHGYTNGLQEVSQQPYEDFIAAKASYDLLTRQITTVEKIINDLETSLATTDAVYERYQTSLQIIPFREQKVKRCEDELTQVFQEEEIFRTETESMFPRSLLAVGIILLMGGVVFMIADFFISQTIVANALSMDKGWESSLFALGISSISLLLKPAYDVIRARKNARRICLWVVGVLTVITVIFMGWFRYEAFRDKQLVISIESKSRILEKERDDAPPGQENTINRQIEELDNQKNKSNLALTESASSVGFFILVGILFAVAGAICLGEGFHIVGKHRRWNRRTPYFPIYFPTFKDYRTAKQQNLTEEQNRLAADRVQLETTQKQYEDLTPMRVELEKQTQLLRSIEQERLKVDIANRIAYYQDGYARGSVHKDTDDGQEEKKTRRTTPVNSAPRQPRSAYKILADSIMTNFATRSNYNQNFELENN